MSIPVSMIVVIFGFNDRLNVVILCNGQFRYNGREKFEK